MSLYFSNQYPRTIYVALVYGWFVSGRIVWWKKGWWTLANGQTSKIADGPIHEEASHYWHFYAETGDGCAYWAGPMLVKITNREFSQSVFDNTGDDRDVGFRELDTNGYEDFTLTLVP